MGRAVHHDMLSAYVYAITVDGVVRYVGKGRRYRVREHYRIARLLVTKRAAGKKLRANRFYNRLAEAMSGGSSIDEIILADGLSDDDAFALERDHIAAYKIGQLWNVTAGGEGFTSEESKAKWTPERRARQSEVAKRRWADPKQRELHGRAIAKHWRDPDYRDFHSKMHKQSFAKPEAKARRSQASKKLWGDPQHRAKMMAAFKEGWSDPELRARRAAQIKAQWANPATREKLVRERRERWKR